MILTTSLMVSMVLLGAGMLLWGIWIATFQAATAPGRKWRFEFYSFDFAVGALVGGLALALTVGNLGWDGFGFIDELGLAGKRQELWAFLAGATFSLGNMLMLGAASVTGITLAVPISMGLAFSLGGILSNLVNPGGNWLMLSASGVVILAALVFAYLAGQGIAWAKLEAAIQAGRTKSTRRNVSSKGFVLTVFAGLFLAAFYPLFDMSRVPDLGVGPYTGGFLVSLGIFATTIALNLFFMNLPVQGKPAEFGDFFGGAVRLHLLGFIGGVLWVGGLVAHFVATRSEGAAQPQPIYQYGALGLSAVIAGLLGMAFRNELGIADGKVRTFSFSMVLLVLIGVALTALSQLGITK
jgi:glucose uptake protein